MFRTLFCIGLVVLFQDDSQRVLSVEAELAKQDVIAARRVLRAYKESSSIEDKAILYGVVMDIEANFQLMKLASMSENKKQSYAIVSRMLKRKADRLELMPDSVARDVKTIIGDYSDQLAAISNSMKSIADRLPGELTEMNSSIMDVISVRQQMLVEGSKIR